MAPSFVRNVTLAVSFLLLTPLATHGQSVASAPSVRLRPGDAVRLQVRDEPDLAGEFPVDEAGEVMLPLIGVVRVAARDFADVRREVSAGFDRELSQGEIILTPLLRIAVMGEVREPSLYAVDPTHTLADVLALAGGLSPSADAGSITLVRDGVATELSADQLGSLDQGLRSGDQIVVGRRTWVRENLAIIVSAATSLTVAVVTTLLLR